MKNELDKETSPYLLQHASNPVAWQAWNAESLAAARESGKPLLVSIGYSACHWCHVMAHESFEDPETAALMNELYVNVKVDREERPDLDKIYQLIHQLTTGRPGGWPLTAFLTSAEHLPIFIGTYFPREPRYGMPSFKQVLERVADYYRERGAEVRAQGESIAAALTQVEPPPGGRDALTPALLERAREELGRSYDADCGGFGDAPKFPQASRLEYLLAAWRRTAADTTPDLEALKMVAQTLTAMAEGGLYDQLAGGFFRYSVDREWRIPHFEKMLYDNAALAAVYAHAYAATGETLYARIAGETADWMLCEMVDEGGGFFAALDADAEGEEGKFYVWTPEALEQALDAQEYRLAVAYYGLDAPPNFEQRAWHLGVARPLALAAEQAGLSVEAAARSLATARAKLLAQRNTRIRPGTDDKVLTAWNALAARALAIAGRRLERPELTAAAERSVDFIRAHLWRDSRLYAAYKDSHARFPAYLDDHAFLLDALLELLQCRWRSEDLAFARELADALLQRFEDPRGGFFFTAHDHETLLYRPKPMADEALPSGNAVAARALFDLGHLLGDARMLAAAERTLVAAAPLLERYPHAHCSMLLALTRELEPAQLIVIRGAAEELVEWSRYLNAGYHPDRLVFAIPTDAGELPGFLGQLEARAGATAYLCRGNRCETPVDSLGALIAALGEG